MKEIDEKALRPLRFIPGSAPFSDSRRFAREFACDLAVPNGVGIGNLVVFSRLVEDFARHRGHRIRLLTAPIELAVGTVDDEDPYPIWRNNPFISEIVNSDDIDREIMQRIVLEQDNYCQFNHIIENICLNFGLRPRHLRGSLFLSSAEMAWALDQLADLTKPVVCLHPAGTSSSLPDNPWFEQEWRQIIETLEGQFGWVQVGKRDYDSKRLGIYSPTTTIRQAMALIWASDIFLGFDSGLAHIATAFSKPAIVLWDAVRKSKLEEFKQPGFSSATMLRWSYPQNRNLLILGEKDHEIMRLCCQHLRALRGSFNRQI